MAYDEALAKRIRGLLNGPTVKERKMFGGLAFLVGGRMCCGVQDSDLMVGVPKEQHEQALRRPHVRPMEYTGKSLTGFVYVSATGTRSAAALCRRVAVGRQVAAQAAAETAGQSRRRRPSRQGRR